jgi:amino acid permease
MGSFQQQCEESSGYHLVLIINMVLLPFLLREKYSNLTNFSAFCLTGTLISFALLLFMCFRILRNEEKYNNEYYNLEPVTVNTDLTYIKWGGMIPYMTIYSGLWENSINVLQLYAEYEKPREFMRAYAFAGVIISILLATISVVGYLTFGQQLHSIIFLNLP